MLPFLDSRKLSALLLAVGIATLTFSVKAQQSSLGQVDFPTSGSEKAQAHFLRGVAALHSFWYGEALAEFREATKAEPGFVMAYWGEAMTYNHPLWGEQDSGSARAALEKIKDSTQLTERERSYVNAVRVLYGEGEKHARDTAYSTAMEKVYRGYPDDLEAASFYALSLLGSVAPEDRGFLRQMKAGAIALEVYQKKPDHPGAAHYIIHAFDDPEHAILALPAARRYGLIAPEAHHARHMPSHIFLQLGMWPEVAAANESSWAVSDAWVTRKNLPLNMRDYHSLQWLQYAYLQQGRYKKAEELLSMAGKNVAEFAASNKAGLNPFSASYVEMVAAFLVETERWDSAKSLLAPLQKTTAQQSAVHDPAPKEGMSHCAPSATVFSRGPYRAEVLPILIWGLTAVKESDAQQRIEDLKAISSSQSGTPGAYGANRQRGLEIWQMEIDAVSRATKGRFDEAIELLRRATSLEESLAPPSGPPVLVKPSHELLGDILLRANRPKEAARQFYISLVRQPNRARSLLGAARAAAKMGDAERANLAYTNFLQQWRQGDAELLELREAQNYLKEARVR